MEQMVSLVVAYAKRLVKFQISKNKENGRYRKVSAVFVLKSIKKQEILFFCQIYPLV